MLDNHEKRQNRSCRNFLIFLGLLALLLALCGCNGFMRVNTNLPLYATKITFINNTNAPLSFLVDGEEKALVSPAQASTFGYWIGGGAYQSQVQVSVTVLDRQRNRSWSEVVYFSSYYPYKYVFTAREDESGRLNVERR